MGDGRFVLGIDSSTQSTTAVILDRGSFQVAAEVKVRYRDDPALEHYGLGDGTPILPPLEEGEASQPPSLFLEALDLVFSKLPPEILAKTDAVNVSAQQHGQVWLSEAGCRAIAALRTSDGLRGTNLTERFTGGFALGRAPIWMSANTKAEADAIRRLIGGTTAVTACSGSDSPLRFSGAVLARSARLSPEAYQAASRVHLISSFIAAVLAGRPDTPVDWGNGSGTGMMNWKRRDWDQGLLTATAKAGGLPGGAAGLAAKLTPIAHPLAVVGRIAAYFSERYGLPAACAVVASSGDNPQSKVLAEGPLLSLGTSFVIMSEGEEPIPTANAMYDGLGRPFLFGCRTNGSLVWELIRARHCSANDFASAEKALTAVPPGSILRILQPLEESFPRGPVLDLGICRCFPEDYAGTVDSSLGLLALASASFMTGKTPISVTGGAASSRGVLQRAASIWNRPILHIADAGAALGAAVAAACALVAEPERPGLATAARAACALPSAQVQPEPSASRAYRAPGGYLERLKAAFQEAVGMKL